MLLNATFQGRSLAVGRTFLCPSVCPSVCLSVCLKLFASTARSTFASTARQGVATLTPASMSSKQQRSKTAGERGARQPVVLVDMDGTIADFDARAYALVRPARAERAVP